MHIAIVIYQFHAFTHMHAPHSIGALLKNFEANAKGIVRKIYRNNMCDTLYSQHFQWCHIFVPNTDGLLGRLYYTEIYCRIWYYAILPTTHIYKWVSVLYIEYVTVNCQQTEMALAFAMAWLWQGKADKVRLREASIVPKAACTYAFNTQTHINNHRPICGRILSHDNDVLENKNQNKKKNKFG